MHCKHSFTAVCEASRLSDQHHSGHVKKHTFGFLFNQACLTQF